MSPSGPTPDRLDRRGIEALDAAGEVAALVALAERPEDLEQKAQRALVYALGRRRERDDALAGLRRLAGATTGVARRDALLALRRHGDPADADAFYDALSDADARVRQVAVASLPDGHPAIGQLATDASWRVRRTARRRLRRAR